MGWLARSEGMAAAALRTVDYVDGRGTIRRAAEDADDLADRDALWAFRGGGGVGVAARLEFGLAAVHDLWAGYLLWPIEHLEAVISAWAAALPRVGPALATTISVLHAPRFPPFPESLRGTPVIHLALASPQGPEHASALREALASVPPGGRRHLGPRRRGTSRRDSPRSASRRSRSRRGPLAGPRHSRYRCRHPERGSRTHLTDVDDRTAQRGQHRTARRRRDDCRSRPVPAARGRTGPLAQRARAARARPRRRPARIGTGRPRPQCRLLCRRPPRRRDSLEPADRERLAAIRAKLDPGNVIAASRFLRDRNGMPLRPAG